jgi:hypothetical protein
MARSESSGWTAIPWKSTPLQHIPQAKQSRAADSEKAESFIPEKAFEPQISQISTDYQGITEFKALTLRTNCDEVIFDTLLI